MPFLWHLKKKRIKDAENWGNAMKFLVAYTARQKVDGFFKHCLASKEVELVSNHHLKI